MKTTYIYKGSYYQWLTVSDKFGKSKLVYRQKEQEERLWKESTEESFQEARYYGKRVNKTISKSKRLSNSQS